MSRLRYYVFNVEGVMRVTGIKHVGLREAILEAFGCFLECKFAATTVKSEALRIASGQIDIKWREIKRNNKGRWRVIK